MDNGQCIIDNLWRRGVPRRYKLSNHQNPNIETETLYGRGAPRLNKKTRNSEAIETPKAFKRETFKRETFKRL